MNMKGEEGSCQNEWQYKSLVKNGLRYGPWIENGEGQEGGGAEGMGSIKVWLELV